jgi:tripartite-type tricarboxylate transporter receptor subunit TctC
MRILLVAVVLAVGAVGHRAAAEDYPARPITMVVPFAAGGSSDTIGRILADGMRGPLGQSILIENVGGASGNVGLAAWHARHPTATRSSWAVGPRTS